MDKHRNPKIDEYIGKRVRIDLPHGSYFGYLNYAEGWYYMTSPEYRTKAGEYRKYAKWSFRKSHIKPSSIREIGDAPIAKD